MPATAPPGTVGKSGSGKKSEKPANIDVWKTIRDPRMVKRVLTKIKCKIVE